MDTRSQHEPVDFRQYLRPIWTRKWLILAFMAVITAGTYLFFDSQPREYKSTATVFVQPSAVDQALFGSDVLSSLSDRNTKDQAALLQSRAVAAEVATELHYTGDPGDLLGQINAQPSSDTDFVVITAQARTPERAALIANTFAKSFIKLRSSVVREKSNAALKVARAQLTQIGPGTGGQRARKALNQRIQELQVISSLPAGSAELVNAAVPNHNPTSPKPLRNALYAFVLSLVIGIALAFALERFDRRIKTIEDVESLYHAPLLSVVGREGHPQALEEGRAAIPPGFSEPMRSLRTNLQLESLDAPLSVLMVGSAVQDEGKSIVARNLALTYVEAGRRVLLFELDLRRPSIARELGIEQAPGLTDVLAGNATLPDAIRTVVVGQFDPAAIRPSANGGGASENGFAGRLSVLTSGLPSPNPPAVLGSDRAHELLDDVRSQFDIVVIDSPPMLPVSDAMPFIGKIDGVLLVSRLNHTSWDAARQVTERLRRIPHANVVGVIANGVDGGLRGDEYGFYYGYEAAYHVPDPTRAPTPPERSTAPQ